MNGPHRDDENDIAAFTQDETESTYAFLWNGIKVALIFLVSIALFGAVAITIWKAIQ